MRYLKIILATLIFYTSAFSLAIASESALSLSPAIYENVVDKGGYVKTEVLLTNLTSFPLPIKGWATAFLPNEQIPLSAQGNYDTSSWFSLEPADFILQPSERKVIKLTIKAPRDAEPGGHYASVFWQPLLPEGIISTPTSLARVGLLALLVVPGNLTENISMSSFTLPKWQTFSPLNISLKVNNLGNVHSSIKGNIKVTNMLGKEQNSLDIAPTTILPSTEKEINLSWNQRLAFGKYLFTPHLTYGPENKLVAANSVAIWFIPWPPILILILLLTIIYKIFILNASRVKLAWRALRGNLQEKDLIHDQVTSQQKNPQKISRKRNRSHSSSHSH